MHSRLGENSPAGGSRGPSAPLPSESVFRKALLPVLVVIVWAATAVPAFASGRPGSLEPDARPRKLAAPVQCPRCWHPALNTSWQWQLSGALDTTLDVQMYDVDLFDTSASQVDAINGGSRFAICYLDAGTYEKWRPDAGAFPSSVLGRGNGWPGERWLDIRRLSILKPIMQARLDQCAVKGFDGVEFDNVDGYQNSTGFPLTARDQLAYNTWLANQAHFRGLSAALKNDLDQVKALLPYFDFALDEQCFQYSECGKLLPFIAAGKPVFEVEYTLAASKFCPKANAVNFNSLKKNLELDATREGCR
jgi:hypothetical protein